MDVNVVDVTSVFHLPRHALRDAGNKFAFLLWGCISSHSGSSDKMLPFIAIKASLRITLKINANNDNDNDNDNDDTNTDTDTNNGGNNPFHVHFRMESLGVKFIGAVGKVSYCKLGALY